jgi:sec-independent protein translocase protein TatC
MNKKLKKQAKHTAAKANLESGKIPLIEHIHELRRRFFFIAACVAVGSMIAYGLERQIVSLLLRPSHGQHFIYTSPLGGMNFLFGVCLDIGLVVSTPVILYHVLAFIRPVMKGTTRKFLFVSSLSAGVAALAGVVFGYFIGLPSALNFLLHQFTTVQVRPLITIQSYMSFVALYLFGSALMFQLPLIMFIINRIKPLKPQGLFKYERHLIVCAFIVAFIMNPTPNVVDQMLVVVPLIIMYQVGIGLIWFVNRSHDDPLVQSLRTKDITRQQERMGRPLIQFIATDLPPVPPLLDISPLDQHPTTYVAKAMPIPVPTQTPAAVATPQPAQTPIAIQTEASEAPTPISGGLTAQPGI